MTTE
jgi:hypothetical protein